MEEVKKLPRSICETEEGKGREGCVGRSLAADFEKAAAFSGCSLHALRPGSGSIPPWKEGPGKGSY